MNSQLRCEPCDKRFDGVIPYQQHLASEKHLKKLRALESPSLVSQSAQDVNFLHCEPCGKKFAGQVPYNQHIISERHLKKMRESVSVPSSSISTQSTAESSCPLCNVTFEKSADLYQHFGTNEHRVRSVQKATQNASPSGLTAEQKEDRDLLIRVIANHNRDFLVCPADMPFMDFVAKHNIFS
ncbi:uncharacterized protein LOC100908719 [Galendromus occidentalis]|uniref:Uncharacterized protein LOC100908719 n=1 Tax=Galendromus occidentalis TaxID=34638 RepID=A0AAJ6QPV9_9ACAR|nr:uncharacterized protein LOC100908719 [Galendromus occidentalis]